MGIGLWVGKVNKKIKKIVNVFFVYFLPSLPHKFVDHKYQIKIY